MIKTLSIVAISTTITICSSSAQASPKKTTGGDNPVYFETRKEVISSNNEFIWPHSQNTGGDIYSGPVHNKEIIAYYTHDTKQVGDNH